ncbi:NAD-dependent epimerase/dehydratase family protein [Patescibacteria group bacterium]
MVKSSPEHKVSALENLTKVLVAGGAGFIGSHLCQLLLDQNCHVFCLDNLATGKKENIEKFEKLKNFTFVNHDLTKSLEKLDFPSLDYVFHMAGLDSHSDSENSSLTDLKTMLVNSLGTENLLKLAVKHKSKFLLCSTPYIFQGVISTQEIESYFGKRNETNNYSLAEAKRFSETLVFEYFKNQSLDCRITRIIDVYGPKMDLFVNSEVSGLFNSVYKNDVFKIVNKGNKTLYPTFIDDLVYGMLKAMFNSNTAGKIFTLASLDNVNVLDLAHLINEIGDFSKQIEFVASSQELEEISLKEEIARSQKDLNWYSKISLKKGIKKTLNWIFEKKENKKTQSIRMEVKIEKEKTKPVKPRSKIEIEKEKKQITKVKSVNKEDDINSQVLIENVLKQKPHKLEEKRKKTKLKKVRFITKLFKKSKKEKKQGVKDISKGFAKEEKKVSFVKIGILIFLFLLIVLLLPFISFIYQLKKGSFQLNQEKIPQSLQSFKNSRDILLEFSQLRSFPFLNEQSDYLLLVLNTSINILEAKNNQLEAEKHFTNLISIIVKGDKGDITEEIKQLNVYLNQIYYDLSFVEGELNKVEFDKKSIFVTEKLTNSLKEFKESTPNLRKQINTAKEVLSVLPELVALDDKKTYLVLLQDNMELRPTGGFINSYGLLSFEKGRLIDFIVKDVHLADAQLRGKIDPPKPLQRYLNEKNWYMRDSNWSPDFPTSAVQAEWFLDKEVGKSVDGTIAMTLDFLKEVLKVIGPVEVAHYNELVDADNLFDKAIYYSEVDFTSNLQQGTFITQMAGVVFLKAKQQDSQSWFKFLSSFETSLNQKQLIADFKSVKSRTLFNKNNWSGAIRRQLVNKAKAGVNDYLMWVEANLGVNKVNLDIERSFNQELTILENGSVFQTLTVIIDNKSTSQGWPGGDYKNYARLLTPLNSKLVSIKIGKDENSFYELSETKISNYQEFDKQVFAFLVEVPSQEKRVIKVTYKSDFGFNLKDSQSTYALYWQKQPGTKDDLLKFKIIYPENMKPLKIMPKASNKNSQIFFDQTLNTDNIFVVDFVLQT